jgi:ribose transport system substrate-binding protein
MKNIRRIVIGILVIVMAASFLFACAPKPEPSPSPAATSAAPETTAPATAAPATSDPNHEVYTMANRIPWAGVFAPITVSRADIDKAIKADNKKDTVKVGYATWTNGTPFFAAMADTIKAECEKYGYEFIMVVSDGDINKQIANIESLVTMGVDVIIDCDYSVEAELAAVKSAIAAGIPVIGLGLPFPDDSPVITTAATNYYEQGFMVGQQAAQEYKGVDVKAATIPGMIGHTIAESKLNGFIGGFVYERAIQLGKPFATKEDAMLYGYNLEQQIVKSAKFSDPELKFDVVASIDGFWAQDTGMKAMEDILTAHPDVNLVFTDNDQEGFGAIKAMQQAGYKVGTEIKIVSVGDGTKEAMQLIKDGTYLGITLASPYSWSKACTDLVRKIFNEGFDATNLPGCTYLDNVLVTKDNVDQYMPDKEFTTLPDAVFTPIG